MSAHLTPAEIDDLRFAVRADRLALSESSRLERTVERILTARADLTGRAEG